MRWFLWVFVLVASGSLASPAAESGSNYHGATPCTPCVQYEGQMYRYGAPACCVSAGLNLQGGCCECQPNCCSNAWAGYCQEKARWQAFWTRFGTGQHTCHEAAVVGCGSTSLPPDD